MKEILVLAAIYIVFLAASVVFQRKMVNVKSKWLYLWIPLYFIIIGVYFDLLVKLHQLLRDNEVYLEFGHADLLLLELNGICYITAIAFVIYILYQRKKVLNKPH